MRFGFSGPRIGLFRPYVSFNVGGGRRGYRGAPSGPSAPAVDYVYVIAGTHGLVKVGISTDPVARLATLQTGSPDRLRIAFTAPGYGNAFTIEQEAHVILAQHRVAGEWFNVTPDLAIAAIFGAADRTGCSISEAPAQPIGNPALVKIRFKAMILVVSLPLAVWAASYGIYWPMLAFILTNAIIMNI
jgi:hypothetical protein